MENSYGAKTYVDPIGTSTVRIDDHNIEFCKEVLVSVQGDRYIDSYATMYLVVEEPLSYNQWEIKIDKNKGGKPMFEDIEAPPLVDPSLLRQVNFVLLQWMQEDDPNLALYYFEDAIEPTLFLEARGANPTTYTKRKWYMCFFKPTSF